MSDWSDYSREVQAAADASWRKQESIIKDLKHCIKELTKERDEWQSLAEAAIKDDAAKNVYYAEMNAKLAKAVEAFTDLEQDCEAAYPPSHGAMKYYIQRALAELKGEQP